MTSAGELLILSLAGSSACSISLTILHLLFVFLLCNAGILTACQSLCRREERDFDLDQEEDGDASTLRFLDTGISL